MRKGKKRSASAQHRREELIINSALAKEIKKKLIEEAKTEEEMLFASSLNVNYLLINHVYKIGGLVLKTSAAWKEEGYKIKKGAKSFTIWGKPKDVKSKPVEDQKEAPKAKEDQDTIEMSSADYEFFPMCCLFSSAQVETWDEYNKRKESKENQTTEESEKHEETTPESAPIENLCKTAQVEKIEVTAPVKAVKEEETEEEEEITPEMQEKIDAWEAKRNRKIDRYRELSNKNSLLSSDASKQSRDMVSVIPMGQPILVGHHSERAHRRLLDRSWDKLGQSVKLQEKADYYEQKAISAESNNAIFSDDPQAIKKLKEKIQGLEKSRQLMKDCNKVVRKKSLSETQKLEELVKLGLKENQAKQVLDPNHRGTIGFPSYSLSNIGQNISSAKKRLTRLEKAATEETSEIIINNIRILDNVDDNRLQLFFDGKPSEEIRKDLKSSGFRWSRKNGCWQRYRGNYANYEAKRIAEKLETVNA